MPNIGLSVVIPVYNSEECLGRLTERLTDVLEGLKTQYEIILVNDNSEDNSWEKITELSEKYERLVGINLRKNFGQDNAIMAGLNHSSGKKVVVMDDDLQHDPADIPSLIEELDKGYDVCFAKFTSRKHPWYKGLASSFFNKVANFLLDKPGDIYLSPYKAMNREVVDEIVKYDGPYPYVDGLLFRITKNVTQVPVEHHERYAGEGGYTLGKSMSVGMKLVTSFSIKPFRIATFFGFASAGLGFASLLFFLVQRLRGFPAPTGWTSLVSAVLFLGGIQLIVLGIIGEYVGRSYIQETNEPQFVVREVTGGLEK